jgi:hypothetical protein
MSCTRKSFYITDPKQVNQIPGLAEAFGLRAVLVAYSSTTHYAEFKLYNQIPYWEVELLIFKELQKDNSENWLAKNLWFNVSEYFKEVMSDEIKNCAALQTKRVSNKPTGKVAYYLADGTLHNS